MTPAATHNVSIPVFEEGRLRYRAPEARDFDAWAAFRMSDRSKGVGGPYTRAQAFDSFCEIAGHWDLRGYGRWLIADRDTDTALGVVGLFYPEDWPEPEIAWSVFEHAEGHGYAYEAAQFARSYAYGALGWTTVVSCTMEGNLRSEALAQRMGATHDGNHTVPDLGTLKIWRHLPAEAS